MSVSPTEPPAASAGRITGITDLLKSGVVLGDGGYLIELERRGYVDSGSGREKVGTGRGSGQFTPEVAIETPRRCANCTASFSTPGSQVLQALTFFGTREKLNRAGYGEQTEAINAAAVQARQGSRRRRARSSPAASRARNSSSAKASAAWARARPPRRADPAAQGRRRGFPHPRNVLPPEEMKVALECAGAAGCPSVATMSFRPLITQCTDGHTPAECARVMADLGAIAVGANCEQDPARMLPLLREMRAAATFRSPRSRPRFAPPTSATASPGCPRSPTTWRRSRCRAREFSSSAESRRTKDRLRRRLLRLQRRLHPRAGGWAGSVVATDPPNDRHRLQRVPEEAIARPRTARRWLPPDAPRWSSRRATRPWNVTA